MPIEIRRPSGAIDEIVAHGCDVHLERCRSDMVFLEITRPDGSSVAIWLSREKRSIRITAEDRPPPVRRGLLATLTPEQIEYLRTHEFGCPEVDGRSLTAPACGARKPGP